MRIQELRQLLVTKYGFSDAVLLMPTWTDYEKGEDWHGCYAGDDALVAMSVEWKVQACLTSNTYSASFHLHHLPSLVPTTTIPTRYGM